MKKNPIDFFSVPKYDGCGVYAIVSWEDMSCYVGSTRNIKNRANQHKKSLIKGEHPNKNLQAAYNDGKILRFVILDKVPEDIYSDNLLLLEYIYMLEMKWKCFDLYNVMPTQSHYRNQAESLIMHIVCRLMGIVGSEKNIKSAIKKTYGREVGRMMNTKYRELDARYEIEHS